MTAACVLARLMRCGACGTHDEPKTADRRKAQAREMVQSALDTGDRRAWNHLPAEEVVLSLTLGPGEAVGGKTTFWGRAAAKAALCELYGDLEKSVSFRLEVAAEYPVAWMGDLRVPGKSAQKPEEIPFAACLCFDEDGKVDPMMLANVERRPLVDAWKKAAEAGRQAGSQGVRAHPGTRERRR